MKIFDKDRFINRVICLVIALLLIAWAMFHLWMLVEYREGSDDMNGIFKLFLVNHILWLYISPAVYGLIGVVVFIIGIVNPDAIE